MRARLSWVEGQTPPLSRPDSARLSSGEGLGGGEGELPATTHFWKVEAGGRRKAKGRACSASRQCLKLRVNGSARGVAARIDRFSEHEQFVATAARELEQPPPSDADKVKLYLHPDGDVVKVEDLEKDDVVVVAFGGSPFKEKLACVEGVGQAGCSAAALPPSCSQVEPRVRKVFETPLPLDPVRFETPFQTPMAAPPRPSCDSPQPAAVPDHVCVLFLDSCFTAI